jgi:hypothetical protein
MRRLLAGVIVLLIAGCGSDNPVGPDPDEPYSQTITGTVGAFGTAGHPLTVPRSGNMRLQLTWAAADVDLDLYLAPNSCTALYPMASCGVLAASDAATGTQETITRTVVDNERLRIWVDNLHLTLPQNYTISITID